MSASSEAQKKIVIEKDGPLVVHGDVPLVRKDQIVSEYGEPLTWRRGEAIQTERTYRLCRCGKSATKPFCDDSHIGAHFDGTETAETDTTKDRQIVYEGSTGIVVKRDFSLCMDAGFCGTRFAGIQDLVRGTDEPTRRAAVIAMLERCPSGSLTYTIEEGQPDVEPDWPRQVAATTEMTSDGPILGPLWVTGRIPIERSDGQPFETRNRVTLCRCGMSEHKPLCDGAHRALGIKD